jgi:hypothetical protein
MDAQHVLEEAVRELIVSQRVHPLVGLSYVLWPTPEIMAACERVAAEGGRRYAPEVRERALALVDAGLSHSEAGHEVGLPRSTVTAWVRKRRAALAA